MTDSVAGRLAETLGRREGERVLVLIGDDGSEREITGRELHLASAGVASRLRRAGVAPGDFTVLAMRHSFELVAAFWGALYAGAVPSIFPYQVPMPDDETFVRQVGAIVQASGARAVLAAAEPATRLKGRTGDLGCPVVEAGATSRAGVEPLHVAEGDEAAYVQYTSGTTGLQKGVVLTHRAIVSFVDAFAGFRRFGSGDVVVSWLPLFHDYGLFAGMVTPLLKGIPAVLMSPFKWIRNPKAFFLAIQRHRATISWMPNFAFDHCVRALRDADLDGLHLGSLHTLNSGGEPVRRSTQERFLRRFGPCGLRESALSAGYGMAEVTLCATISPPFERARFDWVDRSLLETERRAEKRPDGTPEAMPVASCGVPLPGTLVAAFDEAGRRVAERCVGEIALRSPSLFRGYHRRPDLTARVMRDGWFLTGDLGYLAEGELFLCGRKKDLIIHAGRNVQPEDLEALAGEVPGVVPDRAAAFGVADEVFGSERIALVCDVERAVDDRRRQTIEREIRTRIRLELDLVLGDVQLFRRGWVVKTRNGKIARAANREKYLEWRRCI